MKGYCRCGRAWWPVCGHALAEKADESAKEPRQEDESAENAQNAQNPQR